MIAFTDRELIQQIKDAPKDETVLELVSRHTGIYIQIVDKYASVRPDVINKQDLIDQRFTNIYSYALDYQPDSRMKFSSYVGQRIKWECQTMLKRYPSAKDIEQQIITTEIEGDENDHELDRDETMEVAAELLRLAREAKNDKFAQVIQLRFYDEKKTWREIGQLMGISHEGARKIYLAGLKQVKKMYHE